MVVTKHLDDVPGHEDAHGHGAGIADEHLGCLAKDIVDKERKQGTSKYESKHGIWVVMRTIHGDPKHQTKRYAEATGESIHTIDHIHGIDDAHTCKDGEGYANPPRETLDAPQSMQAVNAGTVANDDADHCKNFDDNTVTGREVDDVVNRTNIEHHAHGENDGQNSVAVTDTCSKQCTANHSKKHRNASHDGHRSLLQFTGIGIINEILLFSDGEDLEINPERHQHGG